MIYTAVGTPNIALIKYWGKRDAKLNLPTNSSLSITLDESLSTRTSIAFSGDIKEDTFYLNGEKQDLTGTAEKIRYTKRAIDQMRNLANVKSHVVIASNNYFPTGGGVASSASGGATLVFALTKALRLNMAQKEMSIFARQISGSACRSLMGGIVKWNVGVKSDGSDSYAEQVFDKSYWPDLIDLVCLSGEKTKKVSSSEGHGLVGTSVLYKARPPFAEKGVTDMLKAIREKNFDRFSEIVMRDSNNMHATMLDSWPPIMYMTDISKNIIYKIHEVNAAEGENIAAYTCDAGPNTQIITTEKSKNKILNALKEVQGISKIIEARQGDGPRLLTEKESLLNNDYTLR